jgi:hypothetical protein
MNISNNFYPFEYYNDRHHIILSSDLDIPNTSEIENNDSDDESSFEFIPFDLENQIKLNLESSESDQEIEDINNYTDSDIPYIFNEEHESSNSYYPEIKIEDSYTDNDLIIPINIESPINQNIEKNTDVEIIINGNEHSFSSKNSENLSLISVIDLTEDKNSSNINKFI